MANKDLTVATDPQVCAEWCNADMGQQRIVIGDSKPSLEELQEMCHNLAARTKAKVHEHAEMAAQWKGAKNYAEVSVDIWEERVRNVKRKLPPLRYKLAELKATQAWILMRDKLMQQNKGRMESTAESPLPQSHSMLQVRDVHTRSFCGIRNSAVSVY